MSYNLDQEYTVRRVDHTTPCSLHLGARFTIKEVIPKYKIRTELDTCEKIFTGEEIAKFERIAGGGGNRRSKRKRCRSKRKKRSKKRSKK